jgi:hypothetical protein
MFTNEFRISFDSQEDLDNFCEFMNQTPTVKRWEIAPFKNDDEEEHRPNVGIEACTYCGSKRCYYDCDESQADGFDDANKVDRDAFFADDEEYKAL